MTSYASLQAVLSLKDHLEKQEKVFKQLCYVGLKVDAEKLTFCVIEIDYLGYKLTRDGIKHVLAYIDDLLCISTGSLES